MYTLYYLTGACSLATQVVLNELGQSVTIIDKNKVDDFSQINPVGSVPVLVADEKTLREGAAIMLYLLDKHQNTMLPSSGVAREQGVQDIMFANATISLFRQSWVLSATIQHLPTSCHDQASVASTMS